MSIPAPVKKVLVWVFWIFIAYALVRKPGPAADFVKSVWDFVMMALSGLLRFFDQLLK